MHGRRCLQLQRGCYDPDDVCAFGCEEWDGDFYGLQWDVLDNCNESGYPDGFLGGGNIILESNLTITQNAGGAMIVGL